jgi:excisionase family DNA binding protein
MWSGRHLSGVMKPEASLTTEQSGINPKRRPREQLQTSRQSKSQPRPGGPDTLQQGADVFAAVQAQPIWISVAAAAERAGVNARTIKRWISNGWLSATRLPSPKGMGQLRVRLGDVDSLIARGALN